MIDKFEKLDKEKKERIINASLLEFAKKGYDNASTNVIVKNADISKGLIFHYFGNKKKLFEYLYDYCVYLVLKDLYENIDMNEGDILIRIQSITYRKVVLLKKYPAIFEFIKTSYTDSNLEIRNWVVSQQKEKIIKAQEDFLSNIDYSYFKDDLEIDKAMNVIMSTLESISIKEVVNKQTDIDTISNIVNDYIFFFRKLFYKN